MQEETGAAEASVETADANASAVEVQESKQTAPTAPSADAPAQAPTAAEPEVDADGPAVVAAEVPVEVAADVPTEVVTDIATEVAAEVPTDVAAEVATGVVTETSAEVPTESVSGESVSGESVSGESVSGESVSGESAAADGDASTPVSSEGAPGSVEAEVETPAEIVVAVFTYQPGDIVPGIITVIGPNGIEADLGEGELAVIPKAELVEGHEPVIGEQIEGTVVRHQAGSGRYVISPKRAHRTRSWTRIEAAFEAGEPISGVVKATTKGGLILDLGMRAFLPESLIDVRKVHDISSFVGTTMTVKIIECEKITGEQAATERRSEKIVVNRRVMLETERQAQREALFSTLSVGERRTGTVTALTDFGAFVDIGGGEGLIHVSELAHRQVNKPSDVVRVGEILEVVILDLKPERNKISLSRKAALPSPWDQFSQLHKPGDLVFGTVSGLAAFGVFVTIEGEGFEPVEGLVHISELSRFRVEQASDVVAVGEGVWSQILSIDADKRRVALSMRRALE